MTSRALLCLGLLTCICGQLFLYRLGDRDLWASHEARAAQDAQRILDDGDWSLPRLFDGQVELQKPPLYYWIVASVGWANDGNVDAFAVRLPAALAGIGTVLGVFGFLALRGRMTAGMLTGLMLATTQHFTGIARTGRIDVPLTCSVAGSILCLWTARQAESSSGKALIWNLAGYLAMSAGVLLKGPIGLVLPLAVVTVNAIVGREKVLVKSLCWGLPLVIAIVAPWFAIAHLRTHGEFTRQFFWYHNFQRATGGAAALAVHPWWFYAPRLAFDFLPWSPLVIVAGWLSFRCRHAKIDSLARLGLIWLATIFILLSASRFKRADYLLPAFPGAAIWLGCVGERLFLNWTAPNRARWLALGVAGPVIAIIAGWAIYLRVVAPVQDAEHAQRSFAAAIREKAPPPQLVLLFRVEDHLLAYHLGRPLNTFLEWENLDIWAGRPETNYVLMPAECAAQWRQYITSGTLGEVLRYTDRSDRRRPRDLVLMRTHPGPENRSDGPSFRTTAHQQSANQRVAASLQPGGVTGVDR